MAYGIGFGNETCLSKTLLLIILIILRGIGARWKHGNQSHHNSFSPKFKAGGSDGWTGTELASWPFPMWHFPMWQSLVDIFQMWEQLQSFLSSWQEIIQVHIPKPGKLRDQDAAVPASKLKPISIMSCWRTYITARLAGSQERQWLDAHLVSSQHGAEKS